MSYFSSKLISCSSGLVRAFKLPFTPGLALQLLDQEFHITYEFIVRLPCHIKEAIRAGLYWSIAGDILTLFAYPYREDSVIPEVHSILRVFNIWTERVLDQILDLNIVTRAKKLRGSQ